MSKITCEICGTIYPDTEQRCPICGWTQDGIDFGDELAAIDKQAQQEERSPRSSGRPVVQKPKNREIFDFDAVNPSNISERDEDPYDDEEELPEEDGRRSNPAMVVLLTILIVALLAAIGFIFFRYFLPSQRQKDPTPNQTVQGSETTESSIPTIPCTGVSLTSGMPTLSQGGQFWLLHVVVVPEDTTDTLAYASMDESIATVNEEGRVTAVAEGETTIVVTCGSQRIECPVTVSFGTKETTQPTVSQTDATVSQTDATVSQTDATEETQAPTETTATADPDVVLKLKKTDITFGRSGVYVDLALDCALTAEQVQWSTANPNVATVKNGAVTAVGPGITTITATYGDQTATCIVRCNF